MRTPPSGEALLSVPVDEGGCLFLRIPRAAPPEYGPPEGSSAAGVGETVADAAGSGARLRQEGSEDRSPAEAWPGRAPVARDPDRRTIAMAPQRQPEANCWERLGLGAVRPRDNKVPRGYAPSLFWFYSGK